MSESNSCRPRRRTVLAGGMALLAAAAGASMSATAQSSKVPSLVVLPPDLQDDHENPATVEAQKQRLKDTYARLQEQLQARGLYQVVDPTPARALITESLASQAFLYQCADCAQRIGRKVGSDLVMTSWVQKVSELILNFNVEVLRVADGRSVLVKSVDMRGNNDVSWDRAVRYLVGELADKRAADPHYGT